MSTSTDSTPDESLDQHLTRSQKKRQHWKKIISDWEKNASSPSQFCKSRGLDTAQFSYYRKSFLEKKPKSAKMIPIEVSPQADQPKKSHVESLTLYLSDHIKLTIPSSCDAITLKNIFLAARDATC